MGFERFTRFGTTFSPKITIRSNGQIGFTTGAVEKFGIRSYDFCSLHYDRERKLVGFQFSNTEELGVTVRITKKSQNFFVFAKPFLEYFDIDFSRTTVYAAKLQGAGELIVIDLNNPIGTRTRTRGGKEA